MYYRRGIYTFCTKAIVINTGQADVWTYGATLAINDIGLKGSTLGFVVGMEPKLTGSDQTVASLISGLPAGRQSDRDTGLHIESFYKFRLTLNILITPGIIWLTAPGHNNNNDDIIYRYNPNDFHLLMTQAARFPVTQS